MAAEHDIDLIVREEFFQDQPPGVLVEVGAARPDYLSISASYRALGWKIIAIEPNPEFCAAHRSLGWDVLQYACSDEESDDAEFFVVNSNGADYMGGSVSFESFSSLGIRGGYADLHETVKGNTSIHRIQVNVRKLDTILTLHEPNIHNIDLLTVDVEGWELNVMRGFSALKYRPKVIILENIFLAQDYISYMNGLQYTLWKRFSPNDIYIQAI